jgi:hypothetical protein
MGIQIVMRQLQRGQVVGDVMCGGGAFHYQVETGPQRR